MASSGHRLFQMIVAVLIAGGLVCLGYYTVAIRGGSKEPPLQVFCGAASKPAMEECGAAFENKTGIKVDLQFGGSGSMLSKLKMSQRGDIFIPGSPDYMQKAERGGIVNPKTVKILAYLAPAILVQKGNPKRIESLDDLSKPETRIGIGNPEAVCVGLYAVEILEASGLLEKVEPNVVVHAESCSKTAALIAMKRVDAILGWRVFSKWNPDAIQAVPIAPDRIPRLAYVPAGICTSSKNPERAEKFVEFLTSSEGRQIFAKWGYLASEDEARRFAPGAEIGGEYPLPPTYRRAARQHERGK